MIKQMLGWMFGIALIMVMVYTIYTLSVSVYHDVSDYNKYKDFCEDRTNFCYCSYGECDFKTSYSSISGMSNDTKDLCALAKELNDKQVLFRTGC